jgi:hypothetical protein
VLVAIEGPETNPCREGVEGSMTAVCSPAVSPPGAGLWNSLILLAEGEGDRDAVRGSCVLTGMMSALMEASKNRLLTMCEMYMES